MAWDFKIIMIEIIGAPSSDFESAILYILSAVLGLSLILMVFKLFSIAGTFFKPR